MMLRYRSGDDFGLVDDSGKACRACVFPKYINPPGQKTGVSRRVYTGGTYHNVRLLTSASRGGQSPRDRRPLAMQSRPKLRCSVASWRAPAGAAAATAPPRYMTSVPEPAVFMILLYIRRCYILCTTAQCSVCT